MARLSFCDYHNMIAILEKYEHNQDFHQIVYFVEASHMRYALTFNPTVYVSHIRQFWSTARIKTTEEGTKILATVDGKLRTISESSIRRNLKLNDEAGISSLPDAELFKNLTLMGYNISPNQKFTFQKAQFSHQWKTPRQHNMYSINLNNVVPHKDLTCLVAKASPDESMLWHKRLGHLNFKTMNRLVRHNLVKGLPSKCFENDHTCTAFLKEKQHKASCKSKLENSVSKPLHILHMDLFGPTSDETSGILRNFITKIENRKDLKNGVAERRSRTLIEAARTMLADAKLPVTFWAEAVNTTCYEQNSVLVNKSQNKTSYELFNGKTPAIGFLKAFGCHVMILNTVDHLGKFNSKRDEGYFIGYSMSSNAFRVFNKRTKIVEENLHVDFLENKAIEKGTKDAASQKVKKDVSSLRYIALPNWVHESLLESSSILLFQLLVLKTLLNPQVLPESSQKGLQVTSLNNISTLANKFDDILEVTKSTVDSHGEEADISNMETTITASPTPTLRIYKDHAKKPKNISDALQDQSWVEAMQE
nr:hypothetical protein [Tanacetum cinerariifolium]